MLLPQVLVSVLVLVLVLVVPVVLVVLLSSLALTQVTVQPRPNRHTAQERHRNIPFAQVGGNDPVSMQYFSCATGSWQLIQKHFHNASPWQELRCPQPAAYAVSSGFSS